MGSSVQTLLEQIACETSHEIMLDLAMFLFKSDPIEFIIVSSVIAFVRFNRNKNQKELV